MAAQAETPLTFPLAPPHHASLPTTQAHQTLAHLNNQGVLTSGSSRGTWSCVDGRGDEPQLGTPGGDMGEFIIGLLVGAHFQQPCCACVQSVPLQDICPFATGLDAIAADST
jgi:hypothetical protein